MIPSLCPWKPPAGTSSHVHALPNGHGSPRSISLSVIHALISVAIRLATVQLTRQRLLRGQNLRGSESWLTQPLTLAYSRRPLKGCWFNDWLTDEFVFTGLKGGSTQPGGTAPGSGSLGCLAAPQPCPGSPACTCTKATGVAAAARP